jgi:hypothetical protein
MSVKDVLENFGKVVQKKAQDRLAKLGRNDTGKLGNSIIYKLEGDKNERKLSITAESYGAYIDQGVKGRTSAARAPNSPFRFGSGKGKKGGLTEGIEGWVKRKKIQFKDRRTGKFLSYKSTAWLIARSVYNKGIPATGFLTKPFEEEFLKLPKKLLDACLPEVLETIRKAMKK